MGKQTKKTKEDPDLEGFFAIREIIKGQQLTAMNVYGEDVVMQFNLGQSTVVFHGVCGVELTSQFLN